MFARVCACVPAAAAGQERAHKFEPEEKVNGEKTDEVRQAPFLAAIFEMQARSIYQDRLGTNTGTVEKEGFLQGCCSQHRDRCWETDAKEGDQVRGVLNESRLFYIYS
jgi:hypothetical protein